MRFFLRSKQFKKTAAIVAVVLVLSVTAGILGHYMAPQASLIGVVTAPFQKFGATVANAWNEISENFNSSAKLNAENDELRKEINSLREQLVDYQEAVNENKFYENYLEIKEHNPDFVFCPTMIISRDPDDPFGGFTVDVGTLHGVALYDPVITDEGLVGYVTEIGLSTCKITTLLSPELTCGAYASRTSDAGAVTGNAELAAKGLTGFYNLPRTCSVAVGDTIVTSGNGIFPAKLIIGTISDIGNDPLSSALYASVTPAIDFGSLKEVMIITSFSGQGNELIDGE